MFVRRLALFSILASAAVGFSAHAQPMPPLIKLVVPYPPGGSVDTLARLMAQPLQEQLKTTVVVDNRPGAGGRIAASQVKRESADGSVILIAPNALTTIQSLVYAGRLDYSIKDDFTAVSKLASYPFGLAVPVTSPFKTAGELREQLRAKPAMASFGTSGAGGMAHFSGVLFGQVVGVPWTHVAFKGGAPLITDLIGGHVPVGIDTLIDQIEHHRAGKIRILGTFSTQRYSLAPELPTLAEQGVPLPNVEGWFGAFVSSKTPKATVTRIDQAIGKVLANPELKAKMNKLVIDVTYLPSDQFAKAQAAELVQWAPVVRDSGFKPD
ncbi:MAG: tripartite tricarboxylate transporter substrate-binding protein [Burkholderiaceae bacterium]|nr:tripartite tricarboxylate transporter substrate-binding protein [Burkholderiaceae bacterium]